METEALFPEKRFEVLLSRLKEASASLGDPAALVEMFSSEFSPWEMAHYLLLTNDKEGADALRALMRKEDPGAAYRVDTLLSATRWRSEQMEHLARDFGSE